MAGNREGGLKAAAKNKARDPNFYSRLGKKGGSQLTPTGGFGHPLLCDCDFEEEPHKRARCAGVKGGRISKRGSKQS
jgi:hypothetical protein